MNYGIFNVHTDVNACDCTWGCTDTVTGSALKVDSGRKITRCTGESKLRLRLAGPMFYQLSSYIPPSPMQFTISIQYNTSTTFLSSDTDSDLVGD